MAQSVTTFNELMQEVLLNTGERALTSYEGLSDTDPRKFPARKAFSGMKEALTNIQAASDWGFLKQFATFDAADWNEDTLTITDTDYNRVLGITYQSDSGLGYELDYVTRAVYYTQPTQAGRPRVYCPLDVEEGTILIKPWPDTDEERTNIRVEVSVNLTPLTGTDAQLFPVPERFLPYVRLYAEAFMLENHLGDTPAARVKFAQAEAQLLTLKERYQNVASGHRTMYRGKRKYNR